ncbi:MAG: HD domain-containing protein [Elusimicrobia bacterium]|nr:HD domain-containing protein [Elusimicrobiota bacterium]
MRFSDLSGRKTREDKPKAAAAKPAPAPDPVPPPAAGGAVPSEPLREEARLPSAQTSADQLPGGQAKPSAAPPVPRSAEPPEAVPAGSAPRVRTRREQQRKDEASARGNQRPFRELDAEAREIYSKNLSLAGELFGQIDQPYVEKYEKIIRLAELTSRTLVENPALLNYAAHATAGNYLHAHSANAAIISQAMGLALNLEPGEAAFLGFCALAHDIGMTGCLELANRGDRLTDEEFSVITLHADAGADKVDRIIDMDYKVKERAMKIISQVHERIDSSGYPRRLAGGEIDILAQLIGVADVYEAMSHPRPRREAYHPHNAVKHLIDKEGRGFDSKIVKALMATVTLYPPGSLVALSTGETARVVMANKGSLTWPVVEVLLDANYEPVQPQLIDLMEYPLTAVERIVNLEEISRKNHKFAAKLELARWWVEW